MALLLLRNVMIYVCLVLMQMEDEDADELFGGEEEGLAGLSDIEGSSDEEEMPDGEGEDPKSFKALRKKLKQQQQQEEEQTGNGLEGEEEAGEGEEGSGEEEGEEEKAERQAALAAGRSDLQRLLEEYYKLDYEDNIGGIPCRFKYREVSKGASYCELRTWCGTLDLLRLSAMFGLLGNGCLLY